MLTDLSTQNILVAFHQLFVLSLSLFLSSKSFTVRKPPHIPQRLGEGGGGSLDIPSPDLGGYVSISSPMKLIFAVFAFFLSFFATVKDGKGECLFVQYYVQRRIDRQC